MERKINFVKSKSSDRILSRLPFIILINDEKEYRKEIFDEIKEFIDSVEPTKEFSEKKQRKKIGYKEQ